MELRNDREAAGVVALVGSAGGLTAVELILARLPADLPVPVLVLLHLMHDRPSHAAEILARRTPLVVKQAEDRDTLEAGHVYIAPPGAHLLVRAGGTLEVDHERPAVNFQRPSANLLLRSVVEAYDGRAIAVVLSGMGSDGASGAAEVHAAGGMVFAQTEATAVHYGMPTAAIAAGAVDRVLSPSEIADAIIADVGAAA